MSRPKIIVTEYELNCIHWKEGHKLVWKESKRGATWTGKTRVSEREMNDAEYIKYLESYLEENLKLKLENKRIKDELLDKLLSDKNYVAMCELDTELSILKEHVAFQEENFIKIVEDVIEEHHLTQVDEFTFTCMCNVSHSYNGEDYDIYLKEDILNSDIAEEVGIETHILQEIKKKMGK